MIKNKMKCAHLMLLIVFLWQTPFLHAAPKVVRIATHVSELSPLYKQAQLFIAEIHRHLPGQFEFKLYPNGQLGKEKALITNIKAGSLEMAIVASGMIKQVKELSFFDLPWLFSDRKHMERTMQDKLGDEVISLVNSQKRMVVLGVYENGFRHIINNTHPIYVPKDMEGLKIRVSGGRVRQRIFSKLKAQPQSISWKETFTAMETGVVDGAEAATYGFYEQKHYEVQKYLSLTYHVYTPSFLLASRQFIKGLTRKQQRVFIKAGKSITAKTYHVSAKMERLYFQNMYSKLKINQIPDLAPFRQTAADLYQQYAKKYGHKWLDIVESERGKQQQ